MQRNTSKIEIQTNNITVKAEGISPEATQTITDLVILTERNYHRTNIMKENIWAIITGVILSLSFGLIVFSVTQPTTEVQNVK